MVAVIIWKLYFMSFSRSCAKYKNLHVHVNIYACKLIQHGFERYTYYIISSGWLWIVEIQLEDEKERHSIVFEFFNDYVVMLFI